MYCTNHFVLCSYASFRQFIVNTHKEGCSPKYALLNFRSFSDCRLMFTEAHQKKKRKKCSVAQVTARKVPLKWLGEIFSQRSAILAFLPLLQARGGARLTINFSKSSIIEGLWQSAPAYRFLDSRLGDWLAAGWPVAGS